jgi:predicted secreted hydrolase
MIKLPEDIRPHNSLNEWWYFNGHSGDFSFFYILFKWDTSAGHIKKINRFYYYLFKLLGIKHIYIIHSAVIDKKNKKFVKRISRHMSVPKNFNDVINFKLKNNLFDILLFPLKKPVYYGKNGLVSLGNSIGSHYYSITDLSAEGFIRNQKIRGKAWMDHQWGDWDVAKDRWDCFSIKLKNKTDILIINTNNKKYSFAAIIDQNNKIKNTKKFKIQKLGEWKSPKTGAVYPHGWEIKIEDMNLNIKPYLENQEIVDIGAVYWEGACMVAEKGKKTAAGEAFVELVGYEKQRIR